MKKIMILGAGVYQLPLIETARRMGLFTIVVSIPGNYPGFAAADRVYKLDTRDLEGVLYAARAEKIDGICTSGTDVAVKTVGYVCERMGLPGIPQSAARILTDKAEMKEAFLRGKVNTANGRRAYSLAEAEDVASALEYPVVVKRVDSSGSRGITVVQNPDKLAQAYRRASGKSSLNYVLVEKFIGGEEIGVDGIVQNGRLVFIAPHKKFIYHGKYTAIPVGHALPYSCGAAVYKAIEEQMQAAVAASGADNCFVNADVFVDDDRVFIIEMGGRSGATCIPELISRYYGFDFYEQILRGALGEKLSFSRTGGHACMAKLLMSPVDGVITKTDGAALAKLCCDDVTISLDFAAGDKVHSMSDGTDRIGHVIASVEHEEALDACIARVRECIEIDGKSLEELWQSRGASLPSQGHNY